MPAKELRVREWGGTLLAAIILVGGGATLLALSEPYYPVQKWLLWHYLALIALSAYALGAAWSLGDWLLRCVFRLSLPSHERAAIGLAMGLFGFELGMFLIGAVGGYGTLTFIAYPAVLLLLAVPSWRSLLHRSARVMRQGGRLTLAHVAYLLFGCLALGLIYFSVMTPHNVQFDARWKHMSLAEDFVAHGGIRRMPEGWVFSARPHFTSYLYVWAFSLPFGTLFHRMVLCAHLEFFVFVATTWFGMAALVRRLIPKADPRIVWVTRFLFPGVMLYDSSLSAGADHFGALLAPAIALVTLRAYRNLERRPVLLLVVLLASAAMLKETVAVMLVPVPVITLAVRAVWLSARGSNVKTAALTHLGTATMAVGLGLFVTAPFWLKNVIWYGNPVYPSASDWFPSRPWSDMAAYRIGVEYASTNMWTPKSNLDGLLESLRALVDFSVLPNDWSRFHGDRPVFGSLFTLFVPLCLWLKAPRRLWALIGWTHVALFSWYWVHHQDRYLQALMPIMAACTASILILSFRQLGTLLRSLIGLLIGVQLALGADVYFIATHAMTGSAVKKTVELLSMGYQGKYTERFAVEDRNVALSKALPEGARVLFHDIHTHLGVEHEAVRDIALWQAGLNYSLAKTPAELHGWLKEMGVTHIVANPVKSTGNDRLASDLVFLDFLQNHARFVKDVEGLKLYELPATADTATFRDRVVVVRCGSGSPYSLYRLSALAQPGYGPKSRPRTTPEQTTESEETLRGWLPQADFAVVEAKCEAPAGFANHFKKTVERPKRGAVPAGTLYIRRNRSNTHDES